MTTLLRRTLPWLGVLPAACVVLPPLAWLLFAALAQIGRPGPPFLDPVARGLLLRTLQVALLAAALALALGVPYGWLMARHRLPGRRTLLLASLLPLLLPTYAAALAWELLFAREGAMNALLLSAGWVRAPLSLEGSVPAVAAVLAFAYWPLVAWLTLFAARSVPGELEDAARLHVPDLRAARWSAGPALRRTLPAAALLVLLLAAADFGVPNSLGVNTYPVEIVNRFQGARDAGLIVRLTLPLLLLVVLLVTLQTRWLERAPVGAGATTEPRLLPSRAWSVLGTAVCLLILTATAGTPLAVLAAHSLPLETYSAVWAESSDHFANTLVSAGGGALLALGAALVAGWALRGRRVPGLSVALTLPYALPASLVAVAMIQILNRPGLLGELYTSVGGLIWTYAVLFFPFVHQSLQPAWGLLDTGLLEESELLGAGPWTQFVHVGWPVVRPYAAAGGAMVALLAGREIDATAILRIPGGDTIAFRIYDYLHFSPGPKVAALCVLLVLLNLLLVSALLSGLSGVERES